METFFASPDRTGRENLEEEIRIINNSPIMKVLLNSISGLLAVLDENRQIISVNDEYLRTLGIKDPEQILGLRQGESMGCIHSGETPGGCGTTRHCRTCGAALAITLSLAENRTDERDCALETEKFGVKIDLYFHIKSEPIVLEKQRFLLLFLQNNTEDQQRRMLEKTFFHDFSNITSALASANFLLSSGETSERIVKSIDIATHQLIREIELQRCLTRGSLDSYKASKKEISLYDLFKQLEKLFVTRTETMKKSVCFHQNETGDEIRCDGPLLIRILSNMITNALEATPENGSVSVFSEEIDGRKKISVHNSQYIPDDVQLRIFQRNFTTKKGSGRGIGTYSMKLFGEKILGGEVGFNSSPEWGTEFFIKLPL